MNETDIEIGNVSYFWLDILFTNKALVIGVPKNGLKKAVIPKNMRFCLETFVYSDSIEPNPHPIIIEGIIRPPVNPALSPVAQFTNLVIINVRLNLFLVFNFPSLSNFFETFYKLLND